MYPARVLLEAGGYDADAVAAAIGLPSVDGVPVRPAPPLLRLLWKGPVAAMTLPCGIYVAPGALVMEPVGRARLIVHELVHVAQWRDQGIPGFLRRYVSAYLAGRRRGLSHEDAYAAIPAERQAAMLAADLPATRVV